LLAQNPSAGTNRATVSATLNINPDGSCYFSAPLNSSILTWWNGNRDFVAGAIADGTVAPTATVDATHLQWVFAQPQNINIDILGNQDVYLPMYFPLTKSANNFVKSVFRTLGSVVAVRVTNNTVNPYTVSELTRVWGENFRSSGNANFANVTENEPLVWTGDGTGGGSLPSSAGYTVTNCTIASQQTDTVYLWLKQNMLTITTPDFITLAVENAGEYGAIVKKSDPSAGWQNNSFYGFPITINCWDVAAWSKCYGGSLTDMFEDIRQTTDNTGAPSGYIATGYTTSKNGDVIFGGSTFQGNGDGWVVKLKDNGEIDWQKSYGAPLYSATAHFYKILQTTDGGYITVGWFSDNNSGIHQNGAIQPYGAYDGMVVKLNAVGGIEWQRCLGGTLGDFIYDIKQTNDGYILAGNTSSNDNDILYGGSSRHVGITNSPDGWVVKLNTDGTINWQKCYGGTNDDGFSSIELTNDGYIVAGYTNSTDDDILVGGSTQHGGQDAWVVKLNTDGSINWQKCYGGTQYENTFTSIKKTTGGGYVMATITNSNDNDVSIGGSTYHGGFDFWVVKLNADGSINWQKCYGGTGNENNPAIQQTNEGGYILFGSTTSTDGDAKLYDGGYHSGSNADAWLLKLDNVGKISWGKFYGGSQLDFATSVQQVFDGCYVIAGYTNSTDGNVTGNHGPPDAWVMKF
jgi:hypothetical protein